MAQAGSEDEGGPGADETELGQVVAELRAELRSIREHEVRRETQLSEFDRQVAHMEGSLENGVEGLRSTGQAVDLITAHLRIAVRELLGDWERTAGDLDDLREQITALSSPDLQLVLSKLDQMNRDVTVSAADLKDVRASLEEVLATFGEQLASAAASTTEVAGGLAHELRAAITDQLTDADAARQQGIEQLARQLSEVDAARQTRAEELSRELRQQLTRADEQRTTFTEQVTHQLSQADVALHAGLERLLAEVTAARQAAERRSGSRWRRGPAGDAPSSAPVTSASPDLDQRIEHALQDVDRRLTSLGQLVERTAALAEEAAQTALATYRLVNAPPPPSDTGSTSPPAT